MLTVPEKYKERNIAHNKWVTWLIEGQQHPAQQRAEQQSATRGTSAWTRPRPAPTLTWHMPTRLTISCNTREWSENSWRVREGQGPRQGLDLLPRSRGTCQPDPPSPANKRIAWEHLTDEDKRAWSVFGHLHTMESLSHHLLDCVTAHLSVRWTPCAGLLLLKRFLWFDEFVQLSNKQRRPPNFLCLMHRETETIITNQFYSHSSEQERWCYPYNSCCCHSSRHDCKQLFS